MRQIAIANLKKSFGERVLFDRLTFDIDSGDHIGLVGANGVGKTTLFKIIIGEMRGDGGDVSRGKFVKLGYMEQQVVKNTSTMLYDEALGVFAQLMQTEHQLEALNTEIEKGGDDLTALIEKQHTMREQFEAAGGLYYRSRVRSALLGLGFTEGELSQPVGTLSGGQRSKLGLAKMLLSDADVLLLDEPTNHLDLTSVEWLEDYLKSYSGAFVVISHDRYFLDKVTSKTVEMENGKGTVFSGNYSAYLRKKEEDRDNIEHRYKVAQREIKRIEGIIEQQRRWNREKNIKTAESKQKMVDRLKANLVKPEEEIDTIRFSFASAPEGGRDVLMAENISKSFGDKRLFSGVDLYVGRGERVFLLGDNGSGKTTLFKMIQGQLDTDSGYLELGANIKPGYYDQTQESLHANKTVMDEVWDSYPKMSQMEVRNALAAFLFQGDDVFKVISSLSGGEKARIALLKLMLSGANFLLLDEPTNHLDIGSRETLEDALSEYGGTLFIISHDRFFINKMADKIYDLTDNGIEQYDGDYDYYLEHRKPSETAPRQEAQAAPRQNDYQRRKERESERRKLNTRIRKNEEAIAAAEEELSRLRALQVSPEMVSDYQRAMDIAAEIEEKQKAAEALYADWMQLHEESEAMNAEE